MHILPIAVVSCFKYDHFFLIVKSINKSTSHENSKNIKEKLYRRTISSDGAEQFQGKLLTRISDPEARPA